MSVNKYQPHVYVIPEDRANEQIANGFLLHDQVTKQIQVLPCADGWPGVIEKFRIEYIPHLTTYKHGYVIALIDCDNKYESRMDRFNEAVPDELKNRAFMIGAKETPEALRKTLGQRWEDIGLSLAEDCYKGTSAVWGHDHLKHNEAHRLRLVDSVRSIVFAT